MSGETTKSNDSSNELMVKTIENLNNDKIVLNTLEFATNDKNVSKDGENNASSSSDSGKKEPLESEVLIVGSNKQIMLGETLMKLAESNMKTSLKGQKNEKTDERNNENTK